MYKLLKLIHDTISIYKSDNNDNSNNNISERNVQFTINDQLILETLLIMIRGETIKYSARKKKESMQEEVKLEEEIKDLEDRLNSNILNMSLNDMNVLDEKRNRMYEIRQKKMEGVLSRSRCRYEDLGKNNSVFF